MSTVAHNRTGDLPHDTTKIILVPFNQYEVSVAVSETGKIIGIQEIRVRKDFRSPSQIGYVNVDDYYRE